MEIEEEVEYEIKKKTRTTITNINFISNNLYGLTQEAID